MAAFLDAAPSIPQSSSPAQRRLQMQPPPPPNQAAPRSGSSPRCSPLHPPIKQPRAVAAQLDAAPSVPQSSSPAQRQLPQIQPPPSLNPAVPRSGSSPRKSPLRPPIKQPRAAAAPLDAASSVLKRSSPAQRQLPQMQPPHSSNQAAPRSGSFPSCSPLHPPIKQPRAAAAPPDIAPSIPQMKQPRAAAAPPDIAPSIPQMKQPRAAAAPPDAAPSTPQSSSPAQRRLPQI